MPTYRTPDVYVEEIPSFPPSVAEVGTAIPAFVGYTEKAKRAVDGDLKLKPTKIYSLMEFEVYYGFPDAEDIEVDVFVSSDGKSVPVSATVKVAEVDTPEKEEASYLLYYAVKMYFDNGGAQCYIVSVGEYEEPNSVEKDDLIKGLDAVVLEDEPTLLVIPEATQLNYAGYLDVVGKMLKQCNGLRDRFAVFDVWKGNWSKDTKIKIKNGDTEEEKDIIQMNREAWGGELKYGAAYYPFLRTTMTPFVKADETNVKVKVGNAEQVTLANLNDPTSKAYNTAAYNLAKAALKDQFLNMPPSGAVAGVYAATDAARGVWKAPANVALLGVLEPVVKLNNPMQDDLNIDTTAGKSINAIRGFAGKGTLVWGARTLAGNDNEWRYVSVRRFFNMVEESIKKSTYWAVFEPNDANTWVKVRGMIENYLIDKWRAGALAGATPKDAFFVKCGLGTTMISQDILEGRMNVEIGMAVVRPAEFIILKFSHKLQTS